MQMCAMDSCFYHEDTWKAHLGCHAHMELKTGMFHQQDSVELEWGKVKGF